MIPVPNVISAMESVNPALRPLWSARLPMSMAPRGRMTKPAPNVASDISSEASGLPDGEKAGR